MSKKLKKTGNEENICSVADVQRGVRKAGLPDQRSVPTWPTVPGTAGDRRKPHCESGGRQLCADWTGRWPLVVRHDTIRDGVLTCARKPTRVGSIYRTEPWQLKSVKKQKKTKSREQIRSEITVNSPGNPRSEYLSRRKEGLQCEGFAEKEGFKPGIKKWVGDGIPGNSKYDCWQIKTLGGASTWDLGWRSSSLRWPHVSNALLFDCIDLIETMRLIAYRVRDIASYLLKFTDFNPIPVELMYFWSKIYRRNFISPRSLARVE